MNEKKYLEKIKKAKQYYDQFDISEPTLHDWKKWLETLPKNISNDFLNKGLYHSFQSIPFQAWYLDEVKGLKRDWE